MKPGDGLYYRLSLGTVSDWRIVGRTGEMLHLESASLRTDVWCMPDSLRLAHE